MLTLRPADDRDLYALWLWHNDPVTLANFLNCQPVSWPEHRRWWIGLDQRLILIGEDYAQPIGMIRFDHDTHWSRAAVSYAVAPESRGQGYGVQLVEEAASYLAEHEHEPELYAVVKRTNGASNHIFEVAGWQQIACENGLVTWHLSMKEGPLDAQSADH